MTTKRAVAVRLQYERKEYLKQYIRACIRDNVLSWVDIANGSALNGVLKSLSSDIKGTLSDLGREHAGSILHKAVTALGSIAEDVVATRRQR